MGYGNFEMGQKMWGQPPLWLKDYLVADLQKIKATAPREVLEAEVDDLLGRWNAPSRPVHNSRYLARLFERLDEIEGAVSAPSILRVAAAYQGAKWDPLSVFLGSQFRGKIDSTVNVPARLQQLGVPERNARRVNELAEILASGHAPKDDFDAQIAADASLAVLAQTPQSYSKMCRSLRDYAAVQHSFTERQLLEARRSFLQGLLQRYRLFLTPFAAKWERKVRENLEGELSQIEARLAKVPPDPFRAGGQEGAQGRDKPVKLEPAPGPLVIRGSRTAQERLAPSEPQAEAEDTAPTETGSLRPVVDAPKKPASSEGEHTENTSTLEMFDGLFSHRRPTHK